GRTDAAARSKVPVMAPEASVPGGSNALTSGFAPARKIPSLEATPWQERLQICRNCDGPST
ncbi:MAG: hypothetical protein ACRDYV_01205, partial [Acidimicrobiia bacterium]